MSAVAGLPETGRLGVGDGLLWVGAASLAAAAHIGAALWMMREPEILSSEAAAAAAVMIDLAPMPMAPEAVEDEIAPDTFDAPDIQEAPPPDLTQPPPELVPTPPELTQMTPPPTLESPPSPVETPVTDALPEIDMPPAPPVETAEVAVARPMSRPENLPRPVEPQPERVVERQPERQQPRPQPPSEPPSQAARQARLQNAAPAPAAAAPQTSRAASGSEAPARWQSRLMAHLERHKRYPAASRQRRQEGVVHVYFTIDPGGHVQSAQIARSSGHTELDAAVLELVRRASPVPAPPPGAPRGITAPVRFQVR